MVYKRLRVDSGIVGVKNSLVEIINISYFALGLFDAFERFLQHLYDALDNLKGKLNKKLILAIITGAQNVISILIYLMNFIIEVLYAFNKSFENIV